jgi:hypothetical protein
MLTISCADERNGKLHVDFKTKITHTTQRRLLRVLRGRLIELRSKTRTTICASIIDIHISLTKQGPVPICSQEAEQPRKKKTEVVQSTRPAACRTCLEEEKKKKKARQRTIRELCTHRASSSSSIQIPSTSTSAPVRPSIKKSQVHRQCPTTLPQLPNHPWASGS